MLEPKHHIYWGADRSACEVAIDGVWHLGELRSWDRDAAGDWSASVAWTEGAATLSRIAHFPSVFVRPA